MRHQYRTRTGALGAVCALILLSSCSSYDSLTGSRPSPAASAPPPASSSTSFSQRFSNFLIGAPETTAQAGSTSDSDLDCPGVEIRQGASTYQQTGPDNGSAALSLRYQASFIRFARECALRAGQVTLKVGIEGRVILGPAGASGPITLPVRLAVVKEGLEPKTIWTKFYMVPVDLAAGQPNVTFTHVEENMAFPMPPGNEFDQYVIYVGFDPESAAREPKKPARKPKVNAKS